MENHRASEGLKLQKARRSDGFERGALELDPGDALHSWRNGGGRDEVECGWENLS